MVKVELRPRMFQEYASAMHSGDWFVLSEEPADDNHPDFRKDIFYCMHDDPKQFLRINNFEIFGSTKAVCGLFDLRLNICDWKVVRVVVTVTAHEQ